MSDFKIVKLLDSPVQITLTGSFNYVGSYNNGTQYYINDVVEYNGSSYVAKANTIGNLPTNITYWQLIAEKGDTVYVGNIDGGDANAVFGGTTLIDGGIP